MKLQKIKFEANIKTEETTSLQMTHKSRATVRGVERFPQVGNMSNFEFGRNKEEAEKRAIQGLRKNIARELNVSIVWISVERIN